MMLKIDYENIMEIIDSILLCKTFKMKSNLSYEINIFKYRDDSTKEGIYDLQAIAFSKEGYILMQVYMPNYDTEMSKEKKLEMLRLGIQAYLYDLAKRR